MVNATDDIHPPGGDISTQSQMPYTQVAFGTQFQHPIRTRPDSDEPHVIGVNRLEPVLAGETQRVDIQPGAADTDYKKQQMLLSVLGRLQNPSTTKPGATSPRGFVPDAFGRRPSADNTAAAANQSQGPHPTSPRQQTPQPRAELQTASDTVSSPKPENRHSKDISATAFPPENATEQIQAKDHAVELDIPKEAATSTSAPECSWMKGFVFNSEALRVPTLQRECLSKESSWLKPQPGVPPFQDGNMPQTILQKFHRLADELATLRAESSSDGESDIDPSPDSPPENINLSAESVPQTTQEDDPPSSEPVSWPASPEPPLVPVNVRQELPPDSSLENHTSSAEQHPNAHTTSLVRQSQQSNVIEISENDAEPESSPPVIQAPADSDDEMEMDEFIPQGLGEDLVEKPSSYAKAPSASSPKKPKAQSIVQVRETPYGKGKMADHMASAAPDGSTLKHGHHSSAESKHTSSASIVHSTYDMSGASNFAEVKECRTDKAEKTGVVSGKMTANIQQEEVETHNAPTESRLGHTSEDVQMVDQPLVTEESVQTTVVESGLQPAPVAEKEAPSVTSNTTPNSARSLPKEVSSKASPAMPQVASGSTKRKLDASPVKGNRRHSKRREIKIAGFGDATPDPIDPIAKLQEEREASLRRFREKRISSTSFESRPEPTSKLKEMTDTETMELDYVDIANNKAPPINRSPRHQSLYEDHSPKPTVASRSQHPPEDTQPRKRPESPHAQDHYTQNAQTPSAPIVSTHDTPTTVFQAFKAAYPEYKGDTKHFQNQCKQMYTLDLEDKLVPKWQWDDFIIRNRTDYRDYAMECLDRGENAEPYYRFYKDNIRDTLYRRGVIESRQTLQQALEELDVVIDDTTASAPSPRYSSASQKSLPGSFHQPRRPTQDRIAASSHARPRHSLPTSSNTRYHREKQTSTRTTYASASKLRSSENTSSPSTRQHQQPELDRAAQHTTGDPFRDYFFAIQRSTSWTGDDKIDPTKPWPANLGHRISVQDAPRPKVDVLKWGDVLGEDMR